MKDSSTPLVESIFTSQLQGHKDDIESEIHNDRFLGLANSR